MIPEADLNGPGYLKIGYFIVALKRRDEMTLSCIEEILNTHDECPACDGSGDSKDLRQVAEDVFVPVLDDDEPQDCQVCEGTGFVKKEESK